MKPISQTRNARSAIAALILWTVLPAAVIHAQTAPPDYYQQLMKYDTGGDASALTNIETQVYQAAPTEHQVLEAKLLGVLASAETAFPAKQFACRMLAVVGSPKSVPALGKLLTDGKLSHAARCALEVLPGDAVTAELRDALTRTSGALRIGVVNSLGVRRDSRALDTLAGLVNAGDAATAQAALKAVGRIGGADAAAVLKRAKVPDALKAAWCHASLACAESLVQADDLRLAGAIYNALAVAANPDPVRAAAFLGSVRIEKKDAVSLVIKALTSSDPVLARVAGPAVMELSGSAALQALIKELPVLPPAGKVTLLNALVAHKATPSLSGLLNTLLADQQPDVRLAAVHAVVRLGDVSNVNALATLLSADDELAKAASQTLAEMEGSGIAEALIKAAGAGDAVARASLIAILTERKEVQAIPLFYQSAADTAVKVRRVAIKGLAELAGPAEVPKLTDMLLATKNASDRDGLISAIAAVAGRGANDEQRTAYVCKALARADDDAKTMLLAILPKLGGRPALESVHAALASNTPDVRKSAVRALADWSDATPMAELLSLSKTEANESNRILALRGYIRLIGLAKMSVTQRAKTYKETLAMPLRREEKLAVLAGLGELKHIEALAVAEVCLTDESVKNEAFIAYKEIVKELMHKKPAPVMEATQQAVQRLVAQTTDPALQKRLQGLLDKKAAK